MDLFGTLPFLFLPFLTCSRPPFSHRSLFGFFFAHMLYVLFSGALAVSPDGRFYATGQLGSQNLKGCLAPVFLWDATTRQVRGAREVQRKECRGILEALDRDSRWIRFSQLAWECQALAKTRLYSFQSSAQPSCLGGWGAGVKGLGGR